MWCWDRTYTKVHIFSYKKLDFKHTDFEGNISLELYEAK